MIHHFRAGSDPAAPTLLLLHGTGGNERDLIPLADMIDPNASILGVRGNVLEHGMPRFFRRLAEGVFDEADLAFRTEELAAFLDRAANDYGFERRNVVAIGYSNGANIAASLLFHIAHSLRGAILHHPMVPRRGLALPDLNGTPVFISAGRNDPISPPLQAEELQSLLRQAGAAVTLHWENGGHQLTRSEIGAAAQWYRTQFARHAG